MKETEPYLQRFEEFQKQLAGSNPAWLKSIRRAAIARFGQSGFPTPEDEEWRYTNVAPIAKLPVHLIDDHNGNGAGQIDIDRFSFEGLKSHRLVFVNGRYAPELSSPTSETKGLRAHSLREAIRARVKEPEQHLARYARTDENAFTALNSAFFEDGALVCIEPRQIIEKPVVVLFVTTRIATFHPRVLILAGQSSQAKIIENYVSLVQGPYFTNAVSELFIGENAVIEHCRLQAESPEAFHIATVQAQQGRDSNLVSHSISTGSKLARHNINIVLGDEGTESVLNGLYLARAKQLVDHHTVVDHTRPHCASHEFYHGILAGQSKGIFNGKIFVRKDAQKTDAKQTNKNLLLSEEATINTKPQLEIFADDVKCTHGATVGQLDAESLFYLRARGIGLETARQMLVHAFASDVVNRIQIEPIRNELEQLLSQRLDERQKE